MNAEETKSLLISNSDGTSFRFDIVTMDGDSAYYYIDMIFAMSINRNDVSIWIDEPHADSAEREPFKYTYFGNNNDTVPGDE